jgi:transcriptional regulator with XRE-family HTH domain
MLRHRLAAELKARKSRNSRYSLRAFARDLRMHHGTLSRIMRGERRLTTRATRLLAQRLRIDATQIVGECADNEDAVVLAAVRRKNFVASSRFIATRTGLGVDTVNVALFRLLRSGRLSMHGERWEIHG